MLRGQMTGAKLLDSSYHLCHFANQFYRLILHVSFMLLLVTLVINNHWASNNRSRYGWENLIQFTGSESGIPDRPPSCFLNSRADRIYADMTVCRFVFTGVVAMIVACSLLICFYPPRGLLAANRRELQNSSQRETPDDDWRETA